MSLGPPIAGTATAWYSQYESDVNNLLQRLQDNSSQAIDAKDVRDAVWTLYNQVQIVASQSMTQSGVVISATQSTVRVGGILRGMTYSGISLQDMFNIMLTPYVAPTINSFVSNNTEYQFGQSSPLTLSYNITPGSSALFSINFDGPNLPITSNVPTGSDPEVGTKGSIVPTYSTTPAVIQHNVFTMSVVSVDTLTFSATTSIIYKNKNYFGPLVIPGGFTASDLVSVASVGSYINDVIVKGLTYTGLATDHSLAEKIVFPAGSYFVYAAPVVFDELIGDGFVVNGLQSNAYTKVRATSSFSNEYAYNTPYNVWVSNYALGDSIAYVTHQ
jgi:hypothetical protein